MDWNKYLFGSTAIGCLTLIQLGAWYFGFDGIVTSFCTAGITAVIGYVIGKKLTTST